MNSKDAFARIQAGDYEGTRNVNGKSARASSANTPIGG
jgi:hypothetical protein